jgi:hypothetical protein
MKANKSTTRKDVNFPVGYHSFHKNKHINLHLNRWHSLGYWTKNDARLAGACIQGLSDWKRNELIALAERIDTEGRKLAAAFVYRSAEFFTHPNDSDKIPLYDLFYDHFYMAVQDKKIA